MNSYDEIINRFKEWYVSIEGKSRNSVDTLVSALKQVRFKNMDSPNEGTYIFDITNHETLYEKLKSNDLISYLGRHEGNYSNYFAPVFDYLENTQLDDVKTGLKAYLKFLEWKKDTSLSELPIGSGNAISEIDDINEPQPTNEIYYGVPGSGKSFKINGEVKQFEDANPDSVERVVFHPDYSYSDFVGQILPKIDDNGVVKYEFTPGPFTRIITHAIANPDIIHYLIIEEINRGNAAAIFGDIFQLLDRDENTKYSITNKDIADEIRKTDPDSDYLNGDKLVGLPTNLQLRATMNTSDQNVFTLDNAFQRRWDMKLVENKIQPDHKFKDVEIRGVRWGQFHSGINSIIANQLKELGSAEDKLIGPYFVSEREIKDEKLFAEKVFKYLWNDVFSFDKKDIFCDDLDTLEQVIDKFNTSGFDGVFTAHILEMLKISNTDNEQEEDSTIDEIDSTNDE